MRLTTVLCGFMFLFCTQVMGQLSRTEGMLDISNDMSHTLVQQIPFNSIPTEGSYYYFDEWTEGQIELKSGSSINGFMLKYDIENNELSLKVRDQVKVLGGSKVKNFAILQKNKPVNFVNASSFTLENSALIGFLEIIVSDEKYRLLSKTSLTVQAATYNVAIDMGTEKNKIIKVETFYLEKDDILNKINKNKKKSLALFGELSKTIEQYIKKNKLGFKKKEDLQSIIEYSNTL